MMFTTCLIPIVAALLSFASTATASLHSSWSLGSEVCKQDLNALVDGLRTVPFLDDANVLFVAGMIRSSCTAPATMAKTNRDFSSVPVSPTIDNQLPVVVEVATSSRTPRHTTTLVPLTIDGPDPVEIDAPFDICPWITAVPPTISGPSAERVIKVSRDVLQMTTTPTSNLTFQGRDSVFFREDSEINTNQSIESLSTFLGDASIGDSVFEDVCIIDPSQQVHLSDASIAGIVPRGRAPDSLKDRFPIFYVLLWWFSIGIIGSLVGSIFPSSPYFGKSWKQTFCNVSFALDKGVEKMKSLGGTRQKSPALPAEYLYLIKVPAFSTFAMNFAVAFFRHYHRRQWRPCIPKGLLKYYLQRPSIVVNISLRNPLQLDVLPRQIVETQIFQQRAARIDEDDATNCNQCRALIVSPFSGLLRGDFLLSDSQQQHIRNEINERFGSAKKNEVQTISQCQALVMTKTSILPSSHGSIHRPAMNRQPLIQVIDPKRFGFMIDCAVRVGPHRDVATTIIMERLGVNDRITEITAERDDALEKLDMEVARTESLQLSLDAAGKSSFELFPTKMMDTEPSNEAEPNSKALEKQFTALKKQNSRVRRIILLFKTVRHNEKAERRRNGSSDEAEIQLAASLLDRSDNMIAEISEILQDESGTDVGEVVLNELKEKSEGQIQALEEEKKATKTSHDQAVAKLEQDLKEANSKADSLSKANQTLENEKKQAETDHNEAIKELEEKLAAANKDKDQFAEANQLLRDRYDKLEAKKNAESAKFKTQLEDKESALTSAKSAKEESDAANKKMIDELKERLQEKESALAKTTTSSFPSTVESTDIGEFARTSVDIFEDSMSSGSEPTIKLFIKDSGKSPVQTSGASSSTATPSSSRSSGSFPSWNDYFAKKSSPKTDASDEWEDVSEASVSVVKRAKAKPQAENSKVAKKGRGFRDTSTPKRLLRFDR